MNDNFAKLVALVVVGGVAKALFAAPRTITRTTATPLRDATMAVVKDATVDVTDNVVKRAAGR